MRPMGNQQTRNPAQDGPRINDRIKATEVRLISDTGEQVGVLPIREALMRAEELGLDLVEVSPDAKPPVCRLIDYGKFKYQQSKKAQEAKKKQVVIEVKEINLTPNTDKHDIETKQNHIKRWIAEKARVRVGVKFRGREMSHIDLGYKALQELMTGLEEIVVQESTPRMEGRRLVVTLLPKSEKV
ncbi:translation initiation factor IF-3 [Silvanigrella aquatica]|uniref:Translation initiation factor IF-3 n=1 Tax=Silvanigrella aquatica TaxID=1915309 RepID=A0A1L4D2L7_9BACT|nr:translation initiation factor IF-3 [Silvanigrella aquatica]APJ04431.1 translation initiation factor IF-3 [Silvanigrella aquatica]